MRGLFRSAAVLLLACCFNQNLLAMEDKSGITLTFDDTFVDQWYDYFINGNISSEVKVTFFLSHWHTLSAAQIQKLRELEAAGHEIGGHSYDHQGVGGDYNFDPGRVDDYLNEQIIPSLANMRADGFNPVSYSYPSGERNTTYDEAIRPYFPYLRTTLADDNLELFQLDGIYHDEDGVYGVLAGDGIDNSYNNPVAEIEAALMRAKTNNEIVTLYAHRVLPDDSSEANHNYGIKVSKLNQVIAAAQQMGLKFYTFAEAYQVGSQLLPEPDSNISIAVEGTRANIRWDNLAPHDLIGIVPVGQSEWTTDMPGATTNGSVSGKMGITIPAQASDQQYVAIFYLGSTKIETSLPFTIPGNGNTGGGDAGGGDAGGGDAGGGDTGSGTVTTYMEGNRIRINWTGLPAHDFIGVVPVSQTDWQQGMPGADTSGSASGKMGITASGAVPGQQYIVIFYNGSVRVATSAPFIIIVESGGGDTGGGDTGGGDTGGGDTGTVTTYMEGNRVRIAWDGLPAHTHIGVVPDNQGDWQQGMPYAETAGEAKGKMGITVSNAVAGQQYVVIFYNGNARVISSGPFVIN